DRRRLDPDLQPPRRLSRHRRRLADQSGEGRQPVRLHHRRPELPSLPDRRPLRSDGRPVEAQARPVDRDRDALEMLTDDELDSMRETSVSALPDECVITRTGEGGTLDPDTGIWAPAAATTVYSGACRVRPPT